MENSRQNVIRFIVVFMCIGLMVKLFSCSKATVAHEKIIEVKPQILSSTTFYTGIIEPIETVVVTSPADGAVAERLFQYGEQVKEGQPLFLLSSNRYLSDYKAALMQYVKAKNDFDTARMQLHEADFLHQHQLISDDDFKMKQSMYFSNQLALLQAKDTLDDLLHQLNINNKDIYELSIANIEKLGRAMHLEMNTDNIRIVSPVGGVVLSPNINEENKKILKGGFVKQGDILALIGDMSGISIQIKVNELAVNQLKPGQQVKVTGIGFSNDVLYGQIRRIEGQGEIKNGSPPTFTAEIIVANLNPLQQKLIRAGMSATVELNTEESETLMIPISAVYDKNGISYVALLDKNDVKREIAIKTGKSTMDAVAVIEGLKPGDKIVASH